MKVITFLNNKGGVGKTTLVYNTAWMLSELGVKTVAIDLDPQSNLSSMFFNEEYLEKIFENKTKTIMTPIKSIIDSEPYKQINIEKINENLSVVIGDLSLSMIEDKLSRSWLECLNSEKSAFKIMTIFQKIIDDVAEQTSADIVLIDVGPNLGSINRLAVISSDFIISPVSSDLFSLQGLKNLGETLKKWKEEFKDRLNRKPADITIREHQFQPLGYILTLYLAREGQPVKAYSNWNHKIPEYFRRYMLNLENNESDEDRYSLALIKHYRSLSPMSMQAHKPIFLLKPSDGAIGVHMEAVNKCYDEFRSLAKNILSKIES